MSDLFLFPERRRRPKKPPKQRVLKPETKEERLPASIQGIPIRSKEEGRVGIALGMLGLTFRYQVWMFGGTEVGGQIIDFVVYRVPMPTPLYVQSRYWHGPTMMKGNTDKLKQAKVRRIMSGIWGEPREVWDDQLTSIDHAYKTLLAMFGRS